MSHPSLPSYRTNLPAPLTPLVGREREVQALADLLSRDDVRLLTLTGAGGVGKTRLALHVAAKVTDAFSDGVFAVGLAPLNESDLVLPTIARVVGVGDAAGEPLAERLTAFLRSRHLLLVLDNFEQVVETAPLVTELLAACSNLKILVTSRVRLRLSGEREHAVPPLALLAQNDTPTVDVAIASEAVRLFVERARALQNDFELTDHSAPAVAEICRRLDGLPLAIELAAARIKALPPDALLARLERRLPILTGGGRDLPTRQQTMRDAIAWSYDLLAAEEQVLFRQLAVFVGGFTLEAAEDVGGRGGKRGDEGGAEDDDRLIPRAPSPPQVAQRPPPSAQRPPLHSEQNDTASVIDGISALLDSSLLRQEPGLAGEPRYAMLETIREFGLEQLEASDEGQVARWDHAAFYLDFAERAAPVLLGGSPSVWLDRLAGDHDNLRAALDWLCEAQSPQDCLRLAGACGWYWYRRGHVREGRERLAGAIATAGPEPTAALGHALRWAAELATRSGDLPTAARLAQDALAVWDAIGDPVGRALVVHALGRIALAQDHWDAAAALFEEELPVWRETGDPQAIAMVLIELGEVAYGQGELPRARETMAEAAALFRQAKERTWLAMTDLYFALFAVAERRFTEAARLYRACLAGYVETGDAFLQSPLAGLARVAVEADRATSAAQLLGATDAELQHTGMRFDQFERLGYEEAEAGARAALSETEFTAAYESGRCLSRDAWFEAADEIVSALEAAEATSDDRDARRLDGLTRREREILALVAEGLSDREVAAVLFIGQGTVRSHLTSIFGKLAVGSRTAAVAAARRLAIL